ncbi:MAG: nucleoside triphosphate pyrophosphohydrolase [Gemmatimonadota bacterium]|nr:nucleoside triphosphate pyrophosphohydrolase [Gemmatimonadota bacterium]
MSDEQQNLPAPAAEPLHGVRALASDGALGRSLALVRFLRDRCAWDARQTPSSLLPYLLEEAHEVAEAVRAGAEVELRRELGDLLLNVAFQVVLAEERGAFDAPAVVAALEEKMAERHPHVYGDADEPPDWEELKAAARAAETPGGLDDPFTGIPAGLDPLSRALRFQDRAAARNFDWPDVTGAVAKLREEIEELAAELETPGPASGPRTGDGPVASDRREDELGDLLFAAVNVARLAGLHPATALERASAKFAARFRALLDLARARGIDPHAASLDELDRLWEEVKAGAS